MDVWAKALHFAPEQLLPALDIYRNRFKPSEQLAKPYAMVGVNVIAADTDREAKRLATTQQMSFTNMFRGKRGLSQPPIDDIETYWSAVEKAQAMQMLARSIVGSLDAVGAGLAALFAETGAEELMVVSDIYDHGARLHSRVDCRRSCQESKRADGRRRVTPSIRSQLPPIRPGWGSRIRAISAMSHQWPTGTVAEDE